MRKIVSWSALLLGITGGGAASHASTYWPWINHAASVQKIQVYGQTSGSGAVVDPFAYKFNASAPAAFTLTFNGQTTGAIAINGNLQIAELERAFISQSGLDAGFPSGTFTITFQGSTAGPAQPSVMTSLNGDLYPAATPTVLVGGASGGVWKAGVLVLDPAVDNTIQFSADSSYANSGLGGHLGFSLTSTIVQDGAQLQLRQDAVSIPLFGVPATSAPFTSYTIPKGTLTAGTVYQGEIDFDTIASADPASPLALYSKRLTFYAVAQPSVAVLAPVITGQPAAQTAVYGQTVTFTATVANLGPNPVITWFVNGEPVTPQSAFSPLPSSGGLANLTVNDPTGGVHTIIATYSGSVSFYATIATPGGLVTTAGATLTYVAVPVITQQPASITLNTNSTIGVDTTLAVVATGGGLSYQWSFNGLPISGATASSYIINPATSTQAGFFTVTVTNGLGSATSQGAVLAIQAPGSPTISAQPRSQTMTAGSTAVVTVTTSAVHGLAGFRALAATAATYQWYLNGVPIAGATNDRLVVQNLSATNAGSYLCLIANAAGSTLSSPAVLTVSFTNDPGRLVNLSVLSVVPSSLTMGFVIGGAGANGSENLLIRATGPALALPPFNVPGVMIDPTLAVIRQNGSVTVATNSGWGATPGNQLQVTAADAAVGAFALTNPTSLDSAVVLALPVSVGGYTATVAGKSGDSGYALTEVYDATPAGTYALTTPRLVNLSCLTQIRAGGTLTVGFVLGGSTSKTLLIRVSGPTLAQPPFGIPGTMPDPQLTVQPLSSATTTLAANAGWGGDAQLAALASTVGAFAFAGPTIQDSATLATFSPGVPYTVQATSVSGTAGLVLVEVYEVP